MRQLSSLIDELESAVASGPPAERKRVLTRIADLFLAGSTRYSEDQVELFDGLLLRLAAEIETKARAKLSQRLADVVNAPPKLIRTLAFDDEISVAGPVLSRSPQLDDDDLVANASTKSQDHLYAIAQRRSLSEAVTDVLVNRGNRKVVHSVALNAGARFSDAGFGKLVARAEDDETLAHHVATRRDLPRHHFLKLLQTATAGVRARLQAANPRAAAEIRDLVAEVAEDINREVREACTQHVRAKAAAKRRYATCQLTESEVHARARTQDFERTVVALSLLGRFPVDLVERALLDADPELVLILAKAAGCSRTTAKAIMTMQAADRGLSVNDVEQALLKFDRLNARTARRVIKFYNERRRKAQTRADDRSAEPSPAMSERPARRPAPRLVSASV
ncbi:MAG TPA: DUF2336 domain-containing protein [Xanthobacteraceae bacterium]|nr:DUF2336 domain-containing protein [Xanthobacteraceae bacterium]